MKKKRSKMQQPIRMLQLSNWRRPVSHGTVKRKQNMVWSLCWRWQALSQLINGRNGDLSNSTNASEVKLHALDTANNVTTLITSDLPQQCVYASHGLTQQPTSSLQVWAPLQHGSSSYHPENEMPCQHTNDTHKTVQKEPLNTTKCLSTELM